MDELKNMPASRKRLIALLGVVLIFAFYMLVLNKPDSSTPAPQPTVQSQGTDSGSNTESGGAGTAAGTGDAAGGDTGNSDLPADPTQNARPGQEAPQQTPTRFPGTQPVVLVYNPFQVQEQP